MRKPEHPHCHGSDLRSQTSSVRPPSSDPQSAIQLYALAYPVTSLGPGERVVLWVAGCEKRCEGCVSPEMWDTQSGKRVPVFTLLSRLLKLDPSLAGVTLSGGEPFDQAGPLACLIETLHAQRPAWSIIAYSGYTREDIQAGSGVALLGLVDVLVAGPYRREIASTHPLAGSGNQQFHYLTSAGRGMREEIERWTCGSRNLGLGPGEFSMLIGVPR